MAKGGQFWFCAAVSVMVHAALLLAPLPVSRNRAGADHFSIWEENPILVTWDGPAGEGGQGGTVSSLPPPAKPEIKKTPVTTVQTPVSTKGPVPVGVAPSPVAVTASDVLLPAPPEAAAQPETGAWPINPVTSPDPGPGGTLAPEDATWAASSGVSPAGAPGGSGTPSVPGYPPEPVYAPEPVYPLLARQQGWEGEVFLEAAVLPDGRVESIKILSSSGHPALDNAARKAVAQWLYPPLPPADVKTRRLTVHLVFRLQKSP